MDYRIKRFVKYIGNRQPKNTYPSKANRRNHIKFNKGNKYGGPIETAGCCFV